MNGIDTPVGRVSITVEDGAISAVAWGSAPCSEDPLVAEAARQLDAYFDGRLTTFDLPLAPAYGMAARMRTAMLDIPFGETRTYGQIAEALGLPAQAVGQGCGANTLPILVPCHRVLSASGLGGYSGRGGIETKVALLRHEGAASLLI